MFKSKTSDKITFENSTLIVFFCGNGNATSFALSLLKSNYEFKNIGYLYSEALGSSVSYSSDQKSLEFNGSIYYNSAKNLFLLDLTGGIKSRNLSEFSEEFIKFLKEEKFGKIILCGVSDKVNVSDADLITKKVNTYYLTNDSEFKNNYNMKEIKEAFKVEEKDRKGKKYYEMNLIDSCDDIRRIVQKLILDKTKFLFVFSFGDDMFDPFCGLGIYNKLCLLTELNTKDEEVNWVELDPVKILEHFESKGIKIEKYWKIMFKLD